MVNKEGKRAYDKAWRAVNLERLTAYRAANKERQRAYDKARRAANPERFRVANKAWRTAHPERVRAASRAWKAANKERNRANVKTWRAANPARARALVRDWQAAHPEWVRAKDARRRARIANVISTLTPQEWEAILTAAGRMCIYCGSKERLSMDHLTPLSRGGPHTADNVAPACLPCNQSKHTQTVDEFLSEK